MFNSLRDHEVLTSPQSGFIPGDSAVNQLVDIYITILYFIEIFRQILKRQLEVSPPSICRTVPLIIFAMSLSKKTTPSATSLGSEIKYIALPKRPVNSQVL